MTSELQTALIDAVRGDIGAFERVKQYPSQEILLACEPLRDITFTTESVIHVIRAYMDGSFPDESIQAWGDFARFGYLKTQNGEYIETPLDRDSTREHDILESVARLGELGDIVDGELTVDELEGMLRTLNPNT